jgi:hypothetical protein
MAGAGFPYDGDESLYSSLGRLTIAWAYVEFGLDWLIREIHEPLGGSQIVQAEKPIALQNKLKYLRRAFREIDRLADFRERFEKIADQIRDASDERHDLIHGFIVSQQGDKAVMVRVIPGLAKPKLFAVDSLSILKATVKADSIQAQGFAMEVANFLEK